MSDLSIVRAQECVHFNLGTDELASSQEIREMSDPWDPAVPPPMVSPDLIPLQPLRDGIEVWASSLDLPGTGG